VHFRHHCHLLAPFDQGARSAASPHTEAAVFVVSVILASVPSSPAGPGTDGRARLGSTRPDLFVHFSSIKRNGYRELAEDDKVAFDVEQGQMGPQAADAVRD
jgi:cold shock CspA family protein